MPSENVHANLDDSFPPSEVAQRFQGDDDTVRDWIHADILEVEPIRQGRRTRYRIKKSVVHAIERRDPSRPRQFV